MKKTTALLLTCALTITSNSFTMKKETDQNVIDYDSVSFDVVAELQENNKLLRDIKRQNRVIIQQNYLNHLHQNLHTELCSPRAIAYSCSEKDKLENKYKIASKIKETYMAERLNDLSLEYLR